MTAMSYGTDCAIIAGLTWPYCAFRAGIAGQLCHQAGLELAGLQAGRGSAVLRHPRRGARPETGIPMPAAPSWHASWARFSCLGKRGAGASWTGRWEGREEVRRGVVLEMPLPLRREGKGAL